MRYSVVIGKCDFLLSRGREASFLRSVLNAHYLVRRGVEARLTGAHLLRQLSAVLDGFVRRDLDAVAAATAVR